MENAEDSVSIKIHSETKTLMEDERERVRKASGKRPTFADLIDEAVRATIPTNVASTAKDTPYPLGKNSITIPGEFGHNSVKRLRALVSNLAELFQLEHVEFMRLAELTIESFLGQARIDKSRKQARIEKVHRDHDRSTPRRSDQPPGATGPLEPRKTG